jgi:hypothetical protein
MGLGDHCGVAPPNIARAQTRDWSRITRAGVHVRMTEMADAATAIRSIRDSVAEILRVPSLAPKLWRKARRGHDRFTPRWGAAPAALSRIVIWSRHFTS